MSQVSLSRFLESCDELPRVGRRDLRDAVAATLARVHEGGAIRVTNGNVPDVVVLDTALFDEMLLQVKALLQMRAGIRVASTAAAAGVTLPGDLMRSLGMDVDEEALKRFRSMTPANFTHDEKGSVLPTAGGLTESSVLFADDEDELVFIDE